MERYSSFPLSKLAIVQPSNTGLPGIGLDPAKETLFDPVQGVLSFLKTVIDRHLDVSGDWGHRRTQGTLSVYSLSAGLDREFEDDLVARDHYLIWAFISREEGVMYVTVLVAGESGVGPPGIARKTEDIEKDVLKNNSIVLESPARVLPNGSTSFRFSVTLL